MQERESKLSIQPSHLNQLTQSLASVILQQGLKNSKQEIDPFILESLYALATNATCSSPATNKRQLDWMKQQPIPKPLLQAQKEIIEDENYKRLRLAIELYCKQYQKEWDQCKERYNLDDLQLQTLQNEVDQRWLSQHTGGITLFILGTALLSIAILLLLNSGIFTAIAITQIEINTIVGFISLVQLALPMIIGGIVRIFRKENNLKQFKEFSSQLEQNVSSHKALFFKRLDEKKASEEDTVPLSSMPETL